MIVADVKYVNSVTVRMITPPIVAPTSGMRPKNDMSTASGTANGTPRIDSTVNVGSPLIEVHGAAPAASPGADRRHNAAADPVRPLENAAQPLAMVGGPTPHEEVRDPSAVEQQEERHREDGQQLEGSVDDAGGDALQNPRRVADPRLHHVLRLLREAARDVVLVVELADRVVVAQIVDVAGEVAREVAAAVDDGRHDE